MNILILTAAVFALFIAVDILTAKLFKVKRTALRNISLVVLCVLTLASGIGGILNLIKNANTTEKILYNAYSYLIEGNVDKAVENAEKVVSPHSDMISLLSDCYRGNYASAFINSDDLKASGKLNNDLSAQADKVYTLSRQMIGLEGTPLTDEDAHIELTEIAKDCFVLLKISENSEIEFLSGFKRDQMLNSENYYEIDSQILSKMLLETPNDKELLRYSVNYYNAMGDLDRAEENASQLLESNKSVDNIVLYTDVIAQKLINNININTYDDNDKEIATLLKKADDAQNVAESYEEDNPRREENRNKAAEYRTQAKEVKAKRIINWLTAQAPLFGDNSGVIQLQLSKLYFASGDEKKAHELLLDLIKRKDKISHTSSIKNALEQLSEVYYAAAASDDDIAVAISTILRTDAFLPDSVLSRGYSTFLNKLLKYERVSIFISRVNSDNYPTIRVYLNVNGKKNGVEELANDFDVSDFNFVDNGFEISNEKVTRIIDDSNNIISIALVIDGSGSMDGERIENARRAVEACISNLEPETQELSIIMYDDAVEVLSPLTNDIAKLRSGAKRIVADGGTNISLGLYGGIESLKDAIGTKAIILMTDGEDGNPEEMPEAIKAAQEENIAVFTVSTGGANREYMENIAAETGGSYMEAVTNTELINVYTALQNYIVNNYCFEYIVEEDIETNPRILTVGLADYEVASSRIYSYGGLVLTKDGSYISRRDSDSLRLLYAEPSVVSKIDAELGVPIFINVSGAAEGSKVFINGKEVKDAKIVGDSAIAFTLKGKYASGALNVTVKLPDGTSKSTDKLLSISEITSQKLMGQTITLGKNGNTLYADNVKQKDGYTLKLSGNVILNGFIRTSGTVTVQSNSPIVSSGGRLTLKDGWIIGNSAAYIDFPATNGSDLNYGQIAFAGDSIKVLDSFNFNFDEFSVGLDYSNTMLNLPGFGEVYGEVQFDGSKLTYTIHDGYMLSDLQNNLNYVLNGIPLPKNRISNAARLITGYSSQNQNNGYNNYNGYELYAQSENLIVEIRKDFLSVIGTGTINGYLGLIELNNGTITIDTTNTASMYTVSATAGFDNFQNSLKINGQIPITISAVGYYPDSLLLNATGLTINATGLSECFINGNPPKALDGAIKVSYPIMIMDEPYREQLSPLLSDISLNCDKIEFVCTKDTDENGIKVYDSANPAQYVKFTGDGVVIPISDIDELSLFGTDLGGELSGTATVRDWQIELRLSVDGHLDNNYYGIKHDGTGYISFILPRNFSAGNTFAVTLTCGGKTLVYNATATGSISPDDGFHTYAEDDGQ